MKFCKLGIIFLVCFVLAQCQEVEETEKNTEVNNTENDVPPEKSESPENVETPEKEKSPDSTEKPETPETPKQPESPETPEKPEKPETPETPEQPESPETPEKPETPAKPETPESPETPETTANPETPESEEKPEKPEKPVTPGKRQTPKPEDEPEPEDTEREREPMTPFPGEDSTPASSEDSPQGQPDITLITIGRLPITPRCLLCNFPRNPNLLRSPFRPIGGDGASFFRIPNPRFQPPLQSPNRGGGNPESGFQGFTPNPSNDPLKNFTRPQRLRQLMQDMISYQLKKFENIMNEFMTAIEDEKEKTAMDNVLKGLKQFEQVLKDNQLFDFKVILQSSPNPRNRPSGPSGPSGPSAPSEDADYEFVGSETENVPTSNRPRFDPLIRITGLFK